MSEPVVRHGALLYAAGIGHAAECTGYDSPHRPRPHRFVWHHRLPQVCGGKTTPENTCSVCDSCHYSIHVLLLTLARFDGDLAVIARHGTARQRAYATEGYTLAVAAGTVALIPDEGGSL